MRSEFHYCNYDSSEASFIIPVISRAKRVGLLPVLQICILNRGYDFEIEPMIRHFQTFRGWDQFEIFFRIHDIIT